MPFLDEFDDARRTLGRVGFLRLQIVHKHLPGKRRACEVLA